MSLIELGRVARPHGVRGEVRVRLHWEGSSTLLEVGEVVLRRGSAEQVRRLERARRAGKAVLVKLEGVDGREEAGLLRGVAVCVPREVLPALEEGEYYLSDLVGARVVAPAGEVGEVVEVRVHPSVDTIVIRSPEGRLLEQALAEPWIQSIDPAAGLVELTTTEGLI